MRASYRRAGQRWEGVIRDDAGKVVQACGHVHRNRDDGNATWGRSARECAAFMLADRLGITYGEVRGWT
ncbi:hypothetical protein SEA_BANQUO_7 [Gordonia phage Banquo]|uniref:Uncharacterized protein n=1 Tax=Gordonia phage TinaLin TaxID=2797324 RepID=A0A7T7K891_9CAUD|nr:hypothetical protein KDJ60_gp06 [Gordonia phage TinaLin]QQM15095.1 hypothetical protein SEA_TINALIN_6 [Gordonia phage TinaLin]URM87338.1 hypothetical protein SEA_BANQUO_7 [Gordonia phage Banquo]